MSVKTEPVATTSADTPAANPAASPIIDLVEMAHTLVQRALAAGASDAEVVVSEGDEFGVTVRMGQVETLEESGSRGVGLRVFRGQQSASASTSDLTAAGLRELVAGAMALVTITEADACAGLPEPDEFGAYDSTRAGELPLYFADVYALPVAERIELARRAEAAALAYDTRITNSQGGGFSAATGRRVLVNSRGFSGSYRSSHCGLYAAPLATDSTGAMQRDSWSSSARRLADLDSPEAIGHEAARRTIRRLGARRVPTQQAPIVFAPEVARSLIGHLFEAASGDAIWRGASFLAGRLGEVIAASRVTIIDDSLMLLPASLSPHAAASPVAGFGSSPFDGEGLASRTNVVVKDGVLLTYLLNCYAARKLGLRSTANATRGLSGSPGIGAGNLYLAPGTDSPETILGGVSHGLYVTSLMGFGANLVTGDYSRGASGLWIEHGELTHAVEEVTIAGNLAAMLANITAIGNDLVFRGSVAAPTLRVDGMTIAGA